MFGKKCRKRRVREEERVERGGGDAKVKNSSQCSKVLVN